ncbi:MAG: 30S ribosomal protein S6 [Spirochaetales bacterium]|nr:30S ribosomal protein S6 [Spirochaetales bacterium]
MYTYEATFILQPASELFEKGAAILKKEFDTNGIKILKEENKGELDLSYPIKKNRRGKYLFFELEAPPQSLVSLEKALKIKTEILKFMFIRKNT